MLAHIPALCGLARRLWNGAVVAAGLLNAVAAAQAAWTAAPGLAVGLREVPLQQGRCARPRPCSRSDIVPEGRQAWAGARRFSHPAPCPASPVSLCPPAGL